MVECIELSATIKNIYLDSAFKVLNYFSVGTQRFTNIEALCLKTSKCEDIYEEEYLDKTVFDFIVDTPTVLSNCNAKYLRFSCSINLPKNLHNRIVAMYNNVFGRNYSLIYIKIDCSFDYPG